jgi:hypothetical protein
MALVRGCKDGWNKEEEGVGGGRWGMREGEYVVVKVWCYLRSGVGDHELNEQEVDVSATRSVSQPGPALLDGRLRHTALLGKSLFTKITQSKTCALYSRLRGNNVSLTAARCCAATYMYHHKMHM